MTAPITFSSLPPEAISGAIDQLICDRSVMSLRAGNREVYGLLKDGIPLSVPDKGGGQKTERAIYNKVQRLITNLRHTRDVLLPRLLSGQIRFGEQTA
jgi:hypothetical protein